MNSQIIKAYLKAYKHQFADISKQELYKWKAVKQFQDNWDIEADDFYLMTKTALSKVKNLMASGRYFPKRMLLKNIEHNPEKIRSLFRNLYDESEDIITRVESFRTAFAKINNLNFVEDNDYQDHRAVMVYLSLKYPERYYFYKYRMFEDFVKKIEYPTKLSPGQSRNITHFLNLSDILREHISQDQELIKLHSQRLDENCYFDENLHILTQDFIYAVVRHISTASIVKNTEEQVINIRKVFSQDILVQESLVSFTPGTTNYIQNAKENKRIGDLGELFVLQLEREKLRKANKPNLANQVAHHAKDKGDGLGYDILSFNEEGNEMYIEVKATRGNEKTPFFITRNELERSKQEQDNFFIYRIYNFNDDYVRGDVLVIQGDASNLCVEAINYKVKMN